MSERTNRVLRYASTREARKPVSFLSEILCFLQSQSAALSGFTKLRGNPRMSGVTAKDMQQKW